MTAYGLPLPGDTPTAFALRAVRPVIPVLVRQTASAVSSPTFAAAPLAGAVLLVTLSGNTTSTTGTVTGGGVTTWTQIVGHAVSGSGNRSQVIFIGKVDTTPSASITTTHSGALVAQAVEYQGLSQGVCLVEDHAASSGNNTHVQISWPDAGGIVVVVTTVGTSGVATLPSLLVADRTSTNSVEVRAAHLPVVYPGESEPISISTLMGGTRNLLTVALLA